MEMSTMQGYWPLLSHTTIADQTYNAGLLNQITCNVGHVTECKGNGTMTLR